MVMIEVFFIEISKKKKVSFMRKKWIVVEEEEIKKRFVGFFVWDKCFG